MRRLIEKVINKAKRITLVDTARLYAMHEILHLKRLFELLEIDLVIDVGANSGQYATRLRREVGYKGTIVSVEPIPEMASYLQSSSKHDAKWFVEPIAVGGVSGVVDFNIMCDLQCSSMLEPDQSETEIFSKQTTIRETITVRCEKLDDLIERWIVPGHYKRPFLKLDTQGADVTILKSCDNLSSFAAFQSELSIKRLYKDTPTFSHALSYYCSRGYDVSALVPNNGYGFPRLIEIDCIMIRKDLIDVAR